MLAGHPDGGFPALGDAFKAFPGLANTAWWGALADALDGAVNGYNPFGFGENGWADPAGPEMGAPF